MLTPDHTAAVAFRACASLLLKGVEWWERSEWDRATISFCKIVATSKNIFLSNLLCFIEKGTCFQ